jgi:hypothetical protein
MDRGTLQTGATDKVENMRVGHTADGVVILDLGRRVSWIGMTSSEAIALGMALIEHGKEAGGPRQ